MDLGLDAPWSSAVLFTQLSKATTLFLFTHFLNQKTASELMVKMSLLAHLIGFAIKQQPKKNRLLAVL